MKNFFIILIVKTMHLILKIARKNGGNIIGKVAYKLNPNMLSYFKIQSPIIAVTATNRQNYDK